MKIARYFCLCGLMSIFAIGCGSSTRNEAEQLAAEIVAMQASSQVNVTPSPSDSGPFTGGYLRATINGRRWEATEMTPDVDGTSIITVHGRNKDGFLTFNISGKNTKVGKPRTFKPTDPSSFWDIDNETWQGTTGERVVTHIDRQWIEGTFHFTAEKNGKTLTCTDGEFRVPSHPRAMPDSRLSSR
jgi:hypothetical protein